MWLDNYWLPKSSQIWLIFNTVSPAYCHTHSAGKMYEIFYKMGMSPNTVYTAGKVFTAYSGSITHNCTVCLANVVSILVKEVRRSHHGCLLGGVAQQLQY